MHVPACAAFEQPAGGKAEEAADFQAPLRLVRLKEPLDDIAVAELDASAQGVLDALGKGVGVVHGLQQNQHSLAQAGKEIIAFFEFHGVSFGNIVL